MKDIVSDLARFLDEASLFGERLRTLGDNLDTWHDEASSRHGVRTILTTPTLSGRDVLAQRGVVLEKYESLISSLGAVDDDLHGLAAVLGDGVVNPRAFVTNLRYVIRQIDSELKSIALIINMSERTFLKQMASNKVWLRSMRESWLRISEMVWNNIRTTKDILECVEPKKDVSNADEVVLTDKLERFTISRSTKELAWPGRRFAASSDERTASRNRNVDNGAGRSLFPISAISRLRTKSKCGLYGKLGHVHRRDHRET